MDLPEFARTHGYTVEDGLIQNEKTPLSRDDAAKISTLWMLRWRFRICEKTGHPFDITERGFLYHKGGSE